MTGNVATIAKFALVAMLSWCCSQAMAEDRIKLATQIWPPYQTVDGNDVIGGVAIERVKCAMGLVGQPYEIHVMRWDKAQLMVETGQMHGFFSGSASSQRATYAVPSKPLVSEHLAWFVAPDVTQDVTDETSKYNLRYSAKFNTNKWLYLKREGYNVIKKPRDADALLQMLWQGDIDVAYEYELVFEDSLKKAGIPLDYFKKVRLKKQDLMTHFAKDFVKDHPSFLEKFNASLEACL